MTPYLTDAEIEHITDPLTQGAARIRFFRARGVKVFPRPNGQPLVGRTEWEDFITGRNGSLSAAEIVRAAQPYAGCAGVYFLIQNDAVIYVGQSENIYRRADEHRVRIKFDTWHFIPASDRGARLSLERAYIEKLQPSENLQTRNPTDG